MAALLKLLSWRNFVYLELVSILENPIRRRASELEPLLVGPLSEVHGWSSWVLHSGWDRLIRTRHENVEQDDQP